MDLDGRKPLKQAGAILFKNLPGMPGDKLNSAGRIAVPMHERH
jgi:hypothetical protein